MMYDVAVYGSLRMDMGNHSLLTGCDKDWDGTIKGTLYSNGGFPILSLDGDTDVVVEVYRVSEEVLDRLDWLEGYTSPDNHWYNRTRELIQIGEDQYVEAYIYHQTREHNLPVVESGDWVEFCKNRR